MDKSVLSGQLVVDENRQQGEIDIGWRRPLCGGKIPHIPDFRYEFAACTTVYA